MVGLAKARHNHSCEAGTNFFKPFTNVCIYPITFIHEELCFAAYLQAETAIIMK